MHYLLAFALLLASSAVCVYLLTVLWHIHHVHSSAAWRFIFLGLALLLVECMVGAHLVLVGAQTLNFEQVIFIAIMLAKAICYAIGFTIWKRDIDWLKTLAKQRRAYIMEDADPKAPEQPEHPEHPQVPPGPPPQTPGKPEPQPTPQGDVPGPGKGP